MGNPWIRPRSLFSKIFNGVVRMDLVNVPAKFEVRSFTVPVPETIIAIEVLVWVANPNLGEEEAVGGWGWYGSKDR